MVELRGPLGVRAAQQPGLAHRPPAPARSDERLGDVRAADRRGAREIGCAAGDAQQPDLRARRQTAPVRRALQQVGRARVDAVPLQIGES